MVLKAKAAILTIVIEMDPSIGYRGLQGVCDEVCDVVCGLIPRLKIYSCQNHGYVHRVRHKTIISTCGSRKRQYRISNHRKIRQRSACVLANRRASLFTPHAKS